MSRSQMLRDSVLDLMEFYGSVFDNSIDETIDYCCNSLQGEYDDVNNCCEIIRGVIEELLLQMIRSNFINK